MRILLVSDHDFLPDRVGGRESSMDELANALSKRGHDVTVLAREKAGNIERPTGDIYWPISYATERVGNVFAVAERHLESGRFGFAIYSVNHFTHHLSALADVRRRQILFIRDATEIDGWSADTFRPSQVLIANSGFIADRIFDRTGMSPQLVLPVVDFAKYRVENWTGEHVTFINPVEEKGVELAFAIAERNPDIPFQFVRCWDLDDRQRTSLKNRARSLGNVTITQARLDARDIYAATRVLLVPSRWEEGFGRVVLEAQCNGIPVIASLRGGLPESVGQGGILMADDADADEWSAALESLWNDRSAWDGLSEKASSRADMFERETEQNMDRLEQAMSDIPLRTSRLQQPVARCAAIFLPSVDGEPKALQTLIEQDDHHLDIVVLRLPGQGDLDVDVAGSEKVRYHDLGDARDLPHQLFAAIRETQCAFVVVLRHGDVFDPDLIYALTSAHANSLWSAAVAACDVGAVNREGDIVITGTSNFKTMAASDSRLSTFENCMDSFGLSAIAMPWEAAVFARLPVGLMFRRDALLLLDNPPAFASIDDLFGYLRFGTHLVGGTIYVDRVLCWSSDPDDVLVAMLPHGSTSYIGNDLWDAIIARLVANGFEDHLTPANINRALFGHLSRQRVLALCERHPSLREILMSAFFDDSAPEPAMVETV